MRSFRSRLNQLNLSNLLATHLKSSSFGNTQFEYTWIGLHSSPVQENLSDRFNPSSYRIACPNFSTSICSSDLTSHLPNRVDLSLTSVNDENVDDGNGMEHESADDSDVDVDIDVDGVVSTSGGGDDDNSKTNELGLRDENLDRDIKIILDILRRKGEKPFPFLGAEITEKLNHCGVTVSSEFVVQVLSRTRNDWELAFAFFLWAGKQPDHVHSVREYHSMISILAKRRKFDTAWALIDEMRRSKNRDGESLVTTDTILIMIRRHCAVHDVGSAINAFHALKRFNLLPGIAEFQQLLAALCRYKNVQDAEHLLFSNKNNFPFETKSFNIILNGWCNIIGSPRESKRFWRVMLQRGIRVDVVSYSSIISSYAKSNRLKEVLRLYDQMKRRGITPDRKVYNAVIFALAKGGHAQESLNLFKAMESEGILPNTVTYNSLIKPLCRARKREEAQKVFDEMLARGLQPTIRTYHALLRVQRTGEDIFMLLNKMKETGCEPNKDTYIMLIRKFCRWQQLDNVFKLWGQMDELGLNDDSSSYIVLIHGLFLNSKLEEAHRIYEEMKEKSLCPDPKTDELIQTWLSNKEMTLPQPLDLEGTLLGIDKSTQRTRFRIHHLDQERNFQKRPEERRVVRERGFSFWK